MSRTKTHFNTMNAYQKRQTKRSEAVSLPSPWSPSSPSSILAGRNVPHWISKFDIGFQHIERVLEILRQSVLSSGLIWENTVRRGRKGHLIRDIVYLWCPDKKYALRITKYLSSSPHHLEVIGDRESALKDLRRMGVNLV